MKVETRRKRALRHAILLLLGGGSVIALWVWAEYDTPRLSSSGMLLLELAGALLLFLLGICGTHYGNLSRRLIEAEEIRKQITKTPHAPVVRIVRQTGMRLQARAVGIWAVLLLAGVLMNFLSLRDGTFSQSAWFQRNLLEMTGIVTLGMALVRLCFSLVRYFQYEYRRFPKGVMPGVPKEAIHPHNRAVSPHGA